MKATFFLLTLLLSTVALSAPTYTGKVVGITDDDLAPLQTVPKIPPKKKLPHVIPVSFQI
jgi:hypothetical protein